MRRIKLIRGFNDIDYQNKKHKHLVGIYNVNTFSKSQAISNLSDLISDIDLLVDVGYEGYLLDRKTEFDRLEGVVNDTMHLRNLFVISDSDKEILEKEERVAYVARADLKVEIQFLETNEEYVRSLVNIMRKINKFNERKNERVYSPKVLKQYSYVMEGEDV